MLEAPRTAKTDGACPPFLTIPEPADGFQSKHDRSFVDLGGYPLEDYPRLLDDERVRITIAGITGPGISSHRKRNSVLRRRDREQP